MKPERTIWSSRLPSCHLVRRLVGDCPWVLLRAFILFLGAHLVLDMATPFGPGAFHLNPDESVVAIQPKLTPIGDPPPTPAKNLPSEDFLVGRLQGPTSTGPKAKAHAPASAVLVQHRDRGGDRSQRSSPSEDH